jgi:hypothetical protein
MAWSRPFSAVRVVVRLPLMAWMVMVMPGVAAWRVFVAVLALSGWMAVFVRVFETVRVAVAVVVGVAVLNLSVPVAVLVLVVVFVAVAVLVRMCSLAHRSPPYCSGCRSLFRAKVSTGLGRNKENVSARPA